MIHLRDTSKDGETVRTVPKSLKAPVRYDWHLPTLCGKLVNSHTVIDGAGVLYNICPDCLKSR